MVVCKCRKATRLYCFVHKVPVCGECICFPEHLLCVVKQYSDWVINGEYDWPPFCSLCHGVLEAGSGSPTTRLGCLDVIHTSCLVSHIQSISPQTEPEGYVCPACSTPIWPPKNIKETVSALHSKLKEAIIQSGLEKNVLGNHMVPPPAFASDSLIRLSGAEDREKSSIISINGLSSSLKTIGKEEKYTNGIFLSTVEMESPNILESDIIEVVGPSSSGPDQQTNIMKSMIPPGATTRKATYHVDRQNSEISYYADDEDGNHKKYTRRGPFRHKFLRWLLPFWSNALPTLPVTAPPRKNGVNTDDVPEGRPRQQRSSRMDPRKILLIMAIIACMATMGILYYRLAQQSLSESIGEDEPK